MLIKSDQKNRLFLLILSFLLLLSAAYSLDPGACNQNLASPNTVYTMTQNRTAAGTNCYNITAANVTLDCMGHTILGNNTQNTYGIYSNQPNTTIKNCLISNFTSGVSVQNTSGAIISNITYNPGANFNGSTAQAYCVQLNNTMGSSFANITCINVTNRGLWVTARP